MASRHDTATFWLSCDTCMWLSQDGLSCHLDPGEPVLVSEERRCEKWRCSTCRLAFLDDPTIDHAECFIFSVIDGRIFVVGPGDPTPPSQ